MKQYDWILVGAGIVGSAMGYELAKAGFSVLLLDQSDHPPNATRFSYGGIAYWSGDTDLTQQLCQESEALYPHLAEVLGDDIQFRELDMLLMVDRDRDPKAIAAHYEHCRIPPQLIDAATAAELEPLLNQEAIAAAFHIRHGSVRPEALALAYQQGMVQAGGAIQIAPVQGVQREGDRITGVITPQETFRGGQVMICAGGMSRAVLRQAGIHIPVYYTRAELLETPCLESVRLQTIVMPAELRRMPLEAEATQPEYEALWDELGHEPVPPIVDAGAIQFQDGCVRIGQVSRVLTDPQPQVDAAASEALLRDRIGSLLPSLKAVPATWAACLVAFSGDRLPLLGAIPGTAGLYVCSGFNGPFLLAPPLARRFAKAQQGDSDELLPQLAPARFVSSS